MHSLLLWLVGFLLVFGVYCQEETEQDTGEYEREVQTVHFAAEHDQGGGRPDSYEAHEKVGFAGDSYRDIPAEKRKWNVICRCQEDKADHIDHVGARCSTLMSEHLRSFSMEPHHANDEFGKGNWYLSDRGTDGLYIVGMEGTWLCEFAPDAPRSTTTEDEEF
eukprot:TRINITY_DN12787_c0_g1_i2.p1 TRINITY_DN12787_c0_g1~~TRINITY_DN12787_c0_g1_i2.p1  ORF type:complete len:170 (-),score=17.56 TRINITY_DN12787_c0_g1_i2:260-748(-)